MLYLEMAVLIIFAIIYVKILYNKFGNSIPFLILFLIYAFWAIFSIVYIDNGTYITEQARESYYTGASFRLIFVILPFLICAPIFFCKLMRKDNVAPKINLKIEKRKLYKVLQVSSVILIGYLYVNLIVSGIPIFTKGSTNFNFYKQYSKLPFASALQSTFLQFFILVNGIILSDKEASKKNKIFAIGFYIGAMLYRILFGEKFYPFLVYSVWFFMPILVQYFSKQKNEGFISKKVIGIGIGAFIILLTASYTKYAIKPSKDFDSPLEHIVARVFSLQSHMFWGYDKYLVENNLNGFNFENIKKELLAGIKNTSKFSPDIGLTKIMYIVSPQKIVNRYINNMTRFYGGYWTLSIGMFGYILSAAYSILVAFVFAYYASKFAQAIKNNDFIMLLLTSTCYYIFFTYFNEANFSYIFSKKMILYTIIILLYPIICRKYEEIISKIKNKLREKRDIKSE